MIYIELKRGASTCLIPERDVRRAADMVGDGWEYVTTFWSTGEGWLPLLRQLVSTEGAA